MTGCKVNFVNIKSSCKQNLGHHSFAPKNAKKIQTIYKQANITTRKLYETLYIMMRHLKYAKTILTNENLTTM